MWAHHTSQALPCINTQQTAAKIALKGQQALGIVMRSSPFKSLLPWLGGMLLPYRWEVVVALIALMIGSVSWLALGQGVRMVVDEGLVAQNSSQLNHAILLVLLIASIGGVAAYFRFYFMTWLGERICADIRRSVYQHLLTLSPEFFERTRTGEVISRFTADTTLLQSVVGMGLSMAIRSSVTFLGALAMMLYSSLELTLYVLIAVPVVLVPIRVLGRKVREYAKISQDRVADIGAYVDETLHEIHTVQSYTHEAIDQRQFNQHVESVLSTAVFRIRYRGLLNASVMMLSISAVAVVAWLGAHGVLAGQLSAGELTAFMFYAVIGAGAVATISEVIGEIMKAAGASERLIELLETPSGLVESKIPKSLPANITGHVRFESLGFSYPSAPELTTLDDLSFDVKPGQRVALVGPSGAGKSTLFQLLQQFYRPTKGTILLDGVDVTALPLSDLRQQFALVPQDSVIFASSAIENIRYGRPDATEEAVKQAARAARAHDFIEKLPEGYETNLGERGVRLSGGQKQRIAIARAFLAERPILLLDEATSALDAASEHHIKQALDELMQDKTTLIIAHRLATVVNADHIVVLDQGRIVGQGSHQQLLERSSLYKQFAELQLYSGAQE